MSLTQIKKIEVMNFQDEIRECDALIEQGIRDLKQGKILSAKHTAERILGISSRIQKAGSDLIKDDIPAKQETLNDLLSSRQSDVQHLTEALKNGTEFISFAITYGDFVKKSDAQIFNILGDESTPERKDPADTGVPDYYPADPK